MHAAKGSYWVREMESFGVELRQRARWAAETRTASALLRELYLCK